MQASLMQLDTAWALKNPPELYAMRVLEIA